MAKLTLDDVSAGYNNTTTINNNNSAVEAAIENTLSRDGTSPNTMSANLDMNSNRILNLPDAVNNQEPVTLAQAGSIAGIENPLSATNIGTALAGLEDYADDAAAAVGGIAVGELYRNGSVIQIRVA